MFNEQQFRRQFKEMRFRCIDPVIIIIIMHEQLKYIYRPAVKHTLHYLRLLRDKGINEK